MSSNIKQYYIKNHLDLNINVIEGVDISNIKGIIIHIHGLGSHFQPVFDCIDEFINRDYFFSKFNLKSFAFEFHGHGFSEGLRCNINNFDDLVNDLDNVINFIRKTYDKPIFIYSETMGRAVVIKYCITKKNDIKGVILMAPLCGIDNNLKPNWLIQKLLLTMSNYFPKLPIISTTKNMSIVSTINQDYINARKNNNLFYKQSHRLCTCRELVKMTEWINDNCHLFDKPILIFHGKKDYITDPKITETFYNNIKSQYKNLFILENSYHILLIDNYKDCLLPEYIFAKTLNWIEKISLPDLQT
jgi:acylglycerol lipase